MIEIEQDVNSFHEEGEIEIRRDQNSRSVHFMEPFCSDFHCFHDGRDISSRCFEESCSHIEPEEVSVDQEGLSCVYHGISIEENFFIFKDRSNSSEAF